jgi:predicted nuclease with TOPRIM domain
MITSKRNPKTTGTITKTIKKTDPLFTLKNKLKVCDPEVQNYVAALEKENLKCAKQLAKMQAEYVTLNNRIKVLEKEYPKKQKHIFEVVK